MHAGKRSQCMPKSKRAGKVDLSAGTSPLPRLGRIGSSSRRRPAFRVDDLILNSRVFLHLFTPRNASIHALCVRICCCFSFCSYRLILNSMCLNTLANLFHIIQISKQFNFTMRPCFRIFSCFEEQLQGRCCLHQGCCWPDDWSGCKG